MPQRLERPQRRLARAQVVEQQHFGGEHRIEHAQLGRRAFGIVARLNLLEQLPVVVEKSLVAPQHNLLKHRDGEMRFPTATRTHQQQAVLHSGRIIAGEALHDDPGLLEAAVPGGKLRRWPMVVLQIRIEALKVAVEIALWDARPGKHVRSALLRGTFAAHRHARFTLRNGFPASAVAVGAVCSRHSPSIGAPGARRKPPPCARLCVLWKLKEGHFSTRIALGGAERTMALRTLRSSANGNPRESSLRTNPMNCSICDCIWAILSRMFRMISIPARFTPSSRVRFRITSSRSRSWSVERRVLPCERDGFSNPTRSYSRSVCGCSL